VGLGANLGKVGILGVESGIMDPLLGQAPWGVWSPQAASTGDTCLLGLGNGRLGEFDWEMEKWFHSRIGDGGFGIVDRRVGVWIWEIGFENWGREVWRKNWEILIWEKGSRNALWGWNLRVGDCTLDRERLTLNKMRIAQHTNPSQRERSDA
jgi:hypothetical protein